MVFNLYAIEGYSHKEISKMVNISEGTSKSNLSRARVYSAAKSGFIYRNKEESQQMDERGANIDLVFRNGLKDYEVLPPAEVWENINPAVRKTKDL